MRVVIPIALLAMTALAGCSSGGGAFPEAWLLNDGDVPPGYERFGPEHDEYEDFEDELGAESNPGPISPGFVRDVTGAPRPDDAFISVYINGNESVLISLAWAYRDPARFQQWLQGGAVDLCLEGGALYVGPDRAATIISFDDHEAANQAAMAVGARLPVTDHCADLSNLVPRDVDLIDEGTHGPYDVASGESLWLRFESPGSEVTIATRPADERGDDDTELWLYTADVELLGYNDDNGDDLYSWLATETDPGTHYIRVAGFDGESFDDVEITLQFG